MLDLIAAVYAAHADGSVPLEREFVAWLERRAEETADRVKVIRVPGVGKVLKAERSADGAIHLLCIGDVVVNAYSFR